MLDLSVSNGGYLTTLKSQPCLTAAFALAAAALIPLPVWAQGGFNGPGRYEIGNVRSGKVIDLDRNNQTSVIQFSARNTDNQQWDIVPAEPRFWYFRNAMNGAALEQVGPGNSTPVRGMPFTGSPSWQRLYQPRSGAPADRCLRREASLLDRKSTRLNSSYLVISYAVFCLKKKT